MISRLITRQLRTRLQTPLFNQYRFTSSSRNEENTKTRSKYFYYLVGAGASLGIWGAFAAYKVANKPDLSPVSVGAWT